MQQIGRGDTASGASDPMGIGSEWHRLQLAEITAALLDGRAPAVDGREGRKAVALTRAIYDSAATGTSNSVSHSKQRICRTSKAGLGGFLAVRAFSSKRKCAWHFLQIVE